MLCSNWVSGAAALAEHADSDETSSAFYIQNEWAFFIEDVRVEDEPEKDRSICVMFDRPLCQIVSLNAHRRAIVLDSDGDVFLWSPHFQRGPLRLVDAVHSGCVIRLPQLENIPTTKIVDAKGSIFVLQHQARVRAPLVRFSRETSLTQSGAVFATRSCIFPSGTLMVYQGRFISKMLKPMESRSRQ